MSNEWPEVPLHDVVTAVKRSEVPTPGITYRQLGVKLWGEGAYERESIDGAATKYATLSRVETNDIVVNKIWARNGSVAVVQNALSGCFVSNEFPTFSANIDSLSPRWMHWLTKTPAFWAQCDAKARGTSGKNRIRPEQFLKVEIPLPPLAEQRRIVARIEKLAAKIAKARSLRLNASGATDVLLDATKHTVFTSPRMDKYRTPLGSADVTINREHRNPAHEDPDGTFVYVDISSVGTGPQTLCTGTVIKNKDAPSRARRVIRNGDIVISTVRPNLRSFAKVGQELDNQICSTGFSVISCGASVDPDFLLHQFCSTFFIDQCMTRVTGAHYPAINDRNLREVRICLPPFNIQRRLATYLDNLHKKVESLKRLQAESSVELDSLLPALISEML